MAETKSGQKPTLERKPEQTDRLEPQGFSEHTRGDSGENAHDQGWGLNEEERTRQPQKKQPWEGGSDYDYGVRDFGDSPVDTSGSRPPRNTEKRKGAA